jgi:DNA-directed RNA polymerase subunit RPC12/RpoP
MIDQQADTLADVRGRYGRDGAVLLSRGKATMAVQFTCSQCGQPIEVDDDLAGQSVTCPYCLKVVAVPPRSTLPPLAAVGPGGPAGRVPEIPLEYGTEAPPAPRSRASVLGWVALVTIIIAGLCTLYVAVVGASLARGLTLPKTEQENPEFQKDLQERVKSRPEVLILGVAGVCVLPLAGVVCAIIALAARAQPRWPAILTLCLVGFLIVLVCAGTLMQAMSRAPPGA